MINMINSMPSTKSKYPGIPISAEINQKFRKAVGIDKGNRKGALKEALEEALIDWVTKIEAKWNIKIDDFINEIDKDDPDEG